MIPLVISALIVLAILFFLNDSSSFDNKRNSLEYRKYHNAVYEAVQEEGTLLLMHISKKGRWTKK